MNELLLDFCQDADRVLDLLRVIEDVQKGEAHIEHQVAVGTDDVREINHADFLLFPGGLLLYMAGRFEYFVRSSFAELAEDVATGRGSWSALPEQMQSALVRLTSAAMSRRRGQPIGDLRRMVSILNENLSNESVSEINSELLSHTDRNLRPREMSDLFKRIGAGKLWERVGSKATIMEFFETGDASFAERSAQARLNAIMEARNSVAHPRKDVTWPSVSMSSNHIAFLKALADALSECIEDYRDQLIPGRD